MTPRTVDADVVLMKLKLMQALLDDLETVPQVTAVLLEDDRMLRHGVERILTQLVELAAGINSHLAAVQLGRGAASYAESFALAVRAGVLSQELADRLAPSAGLRNVLVHEYVAVDLAKVAAGVPLALRDYREYIRVVAAAL